MGGKIKPSGSKIYDLATTVIQVHEMNTDRWCRLPADGRRGPWLSAKYEILNRPLWERRSPCLYLVGASDGALRYVGISRNRLKDRWRVSPAYHETTLEPLG